MSRKILRGRRIFLYSILGNIIEYYDFTAYAFFISTISLNFFPYSSSQKMQAFATFAVGFFLRPIGGIVFGYIGDRFGRKQVLVLTSFCMSCATLLIGCLPTYDQIGYISSFILIILRLVQGLCISGEGTGTAIFLLEHFTKSKPGLITGIIQGTSMVGTLIVTSISTFLSYFICSNNSLLKMRVIFIIGGVFGFYSLYLRTKISETPIFKKMQKNKQNKSNFYEVVKTQKIQMLLTFIVASCAGSILQFFKSYLNVHLRNMHILTELLISLGMGFVIIFTILIGFLLDKVKNLYNVLIVSCVFIFTCSLPCMILICSTRYTACFIGLNLFALMSAMICVPAYVFTISLFHPKNRFLGVSFSYNLGIAAFGGTCPMICEYLVNKTKLIYSPAYYFMTTSFILLISLLLMKRYKKRAEER